jgi:dihydrofolate reductase
MRKIIVSAQISLDGVMQSPGAPTEDPTRGFRYGGWSTPYFEPEFNEEIEHLYRDRFDLLLGRKTYELLAAHWPYYDESRCAGNTARLFNSIKKYVVSRSGDVETSWQGSVQLRDLAGVKRLKQQDGPHLLTQGSTTLVHALLANDLVDEIKIFMVPVVLGGGKKLFEDGSAPHAYKMIRSRVAHNGTLIAQYARAGAVKIGNGAVHHPSEAEAARQKRMRREG